MIKRLPCNIEFLSGWLRAINDNYDGVARRRLRHYVRALRPPGKLLPSKNVESDVGTG
jgi:hypothetical protein